jgi:type IV pilus assembly protein PilM
MNKRINILIKNIMDLPDFFGLDIGNHSIKAAEVDRKSIDSAVIRKLVRIETPFGVLNSEDKNAKLKLSERIKQLHENSGIGTKKCVAALPEASIFTRLITVPKVEEAKLEELVHWEARQYIPLPLADVQKDYIKIEEKKINGKPMLQLLLVAAPKSLVNRYVEVVNGAGLELLAVETETIATARLVAFEGYTTQTVMVLDFGANGTDISVVKNGRLIFSQSLGTGSDALTKAIGNDFNLEFAQAEQYKVAYGLDETKAEGKIYKSIEPIMQVITDEITRTLNFFKTQLPDSLPSQALLVGDGSKLKKLDAYLSSRIGIKVKVENLYSRLSLDKSIQNDIKQEDLAGYTVSIGLGLKSS